MPTALTTPLSEVDLAARALLRAGRPVLLAVSGGCDSMVLMHAIAGALAEADADEPPPPAVSVVTFDHGTGPAAARAVALVGREGARLGLRVARGRASLAHASEAEWRAARWTFFRAAARRYGAVVATAHTRDDQIETVVMRVMRGAGARGLAGLAAPASGVARPFLGLSRQQLRDHARDRGVPFVEDPSNASRAHLRNRVRHDLLPAISRIRPDFGDEMLDVSRRAAEWRAEVDSLAVRYVLDADQGSGFRVARPELARYDSAALCVLWPAIAARAGLTLDRRGTLRLAQFTTSGAAGARMQLSGGIEVLRARDVFVLQPVTSPNGVSGAVPLAGVVQFGGWRFSPAATPRWPGVASAARETHGGGARVERGSAWTAELPANGRLWVRAWRPGDRMRPNPAGAARRVKRFLADARVPGPNRTGWPVVLVEDEIVWIPGVRRGGAASERSGRPTVRYTCERFDGGLPGN